MIEWLAIPAGIVSGAVSGWAAAWVGRPAAAAAAEESKARMAARRELVEDGHTLVADADRDWSSNASVAVDPRFVALRGHLLLHTRAQYDLDYSPRTTRVEPEGRPDHTALRDDIERLAQEWKLA